eukprot:16250277-Heterocapsa_arctica.AAC.1
MAFQIMTLLVTLGRWTICTWFLSMCITGTITSSRRFDLTLDITLRFGTVNYVYHFRSVVFRAVGVPALDSLMDGVGLWPRALLILKRLPDI